MKSEEKDPIVESVINQFRERSSVGLKKYGKSLARTDLTLIDWVRHAKEEAMDLVNYLERIEQELNEKDKSNL